MSPAEELRVAATRIREVATAATAGPWIPGQGPGTGNVFIDGVEHLVADMPACSDHPDMQQVDAEHIAMWHPGVALAIADWLDDEARWPEAAAENYATSTSGRVVLVVARAINGGEQS